MLPGSIAKPWKTIMALNDTPTSTTQAPDAAEYISLVIDAPPVAVWAALTMPERMNRWMFDSELEIITNWAVGNPIVIRGDMHGMPFENTGTVLRFQPTEALGYSHLSSLSELPDVPGNHAIHDFTLKEDGTGTVLELRLSNFPTEYIRKHLVFYWRGALAVMQRMLESGDA